MADSQRKTANLFDGVIEQGSYETSVTPITKIESQWRCRTSSFIDVSENLNYSVSLLGADNDIFCVVHFLNSAKGKISEVGWSSAPFSFTTPSGCHYIDIIFKNEAGGVITPSSCGLLMVNEGSTALPYAPYWQHSLRKLTTATETIQSGDTIYADGTAATVNLKGNTTQSGTPSPSNPVDVNGVGVRTENLYNINAHDVNNGYVNDAQLSQDGTTETWGNAEISEYIPISGDTAYTFNGIGSYNSPCYGLYDENKQLIGAYRYNGRSTINFTSPNNARYFRFTHLKTATQAMTVEGTYISSTMPEFEPYGYKIPISCGGKNLFDYVSYFDSVFTPYNEYLNYAELQLQPNTTYTLSTSYEEYLWTSTRITAFIVATSSDVPTTANGGISNVSPITITTESDGVLKLYKRISGSSEDMLPTEEQFEGGDWIMLNEGSTPSPYEPYNRITTPVYLGEVQTTRKIYKLVLDGTEDWKVLSSDNSKYYLNYLAIDYLRADSQITYMCTHYIPYEQTVSATLVPNLKMSMSSGNAQRIYIADANFTTTDQFKAYLAAQYAAGTPVTVYYVLTTPQTGITNEPLIKIDAYADSISTSIPCTAGENTLDVQTTVQPSEVTATFEGWHAVSAAHERENGQWD